MVIKLKLILLKELGVAEYMMRVEEDGYIH